MQDIPQQGAIASIFLPRLIARLHRDEFEGALRLSTDAVSRAIYFKRGEIASAASNADEDRLQNLLIDEGRLTASQMETAKSRSEGGASLGRTLIEMGLLTPGELLECARRQVRQILAGCFAIRGGTYEVASGPLPPQVTVLGLPTRSLIFDSLMQATDRQYIVREMGSMESIYRPTAGMGPGLGALRLEPDLEQVARAIDGGLSLRQISGSTALDDFAVSKIVLALDILGMAERIDAPAASPSIGASRIVPIDPEGAAIEPAPLVIESVGVGPDLDGPVPEPTVPIGPGSRLGTPAVAIGAPPGEPPGPVEPPDGPPSRTGAPEADEPPSPFAPGELPAFAEPSGGEAQWSVDPRTGERIHVGPIELTFNGRVGGAHDRPSRFTRYLGVALTIVLVGGSVLIYMTREREGRRPAPDAGTPATATARTAPEERLSPPIGEPIPRPTPGRDTPHDADSKASAPGEAGPGRGSSREAENGGGTTTAPPPIASGTRAAGSGEASGPVPKSEPTPQPEPVPGPDPIPASEPARTPEPVTALEPLATPDPPRTTEPARPTGTTAAPVPAPAAAERGAIRPVTGSPFRSAAEYAAALGMLDSGQIGPAAARFQKLVIDEGGPGFTLQLMIACEPETIRNLRARTGHRGPLFILPYSFRGRACLRVCWGVYPTAEAAREATQSLPGALAEAGVKPVVVSTARLRPPA